MTSTEALEMTKAWPSDRTVPRRLKKVIDNSKGRTKEEMEMMVEGLYVSSETSEDFDVLNRYFQWSCFLTYV